VPEVLRTANGMIDLELAVDRPTLARAAGALVRRSLDVCDKALAKAGVTSKDLTAIYLCGGSTHLPSVRDAGGRPLRAPRPPAAAAPRAGAGRGPAAPRARRAARPRPGRRAPLGGAGVWPGGPPPPPLPPVRFPPRGGPPALAGGGTTNPPATRGVPAIPP